MNAYNLGPFVDVEAGAVLVLVVILVLGGCGNPGNSWLGEISKK